MIHYHRPNPILHPTHPFTHSFILSFDAHNSHLTASTSPLSPPLLHVPFITALPHTPRAHKNGQHVTPIEAHSPVKIIELLLTPGTCLATTAYVYTQLHSCALCVTIYVYSNSSITPTVSNFRSYTLLPPPSFTSSLHLLHLLPPSPPPSYSLPPHQ